MTRLRTKPSSRRESSLAFAPLSPAVLVVALTIMALTAGGAFCQDQDLSGQLVTVKRVYVDRLTGGETAAQMRELLIASLQNARLFILTEKEERADMVLKGAAEDLIFTDAFSSSEGINMRAGTSNGSGSSTSSRYNGASSGYSDRSSRSLNLGVGDNESSNIKQRMHEALATVRLVNKDGDVVWSTTQESTGAKFRGASADVADRITRQLVSDYERVRKPPANPETRTAPAAR
jgi:hypothetical protein